MYKHILLASDGSDNAVRAAKEAVKVVTCNEDSLIDVVYVADFEKSKSDVLHSSSAEALDLERRKKNSKVLKFLNEAKVNYQTTILRGNPGPEIVKYANEQQVDLVVIGSRGLNALQEMVLGSVSHKVMKRVKCPALIVK
ncbi:universal stress protein [Lysinibacillus sp. OL1_EC]|uniref:Universal stress protein n=1 Tax=Lysinibacillus boronitolerans JCM 21713 = 10a = NBRC 103108 TaxID=1294264 RepID=A0ABR4Y6I1_9BACI|nr:MULTISPECIES: universal stress protein [Lysinibacillus]MDC6267295.1 universal stress protein [Lysinibacillus sphaericus]KGR89425.1 universal stress protein [Lysinibacillus boronitolerans JCM 21713 = 10a = NBRC 103108]MCM0627432.1 universal stress protein [Lysinibacillus sp. OL1_EC]MDN4968271.1 universal stress protein [Lysinibacillus fusiformis]MDN4968445.1 universal stress protein [Lysinibacillus fusiformis]